MRSDLPWTLCGRRIKPLALASAVAVGGTFMGVFYGGSNTAFEVRSMPGYFLAFISVLTGVLFLVSWWRQSESLLRLACLFTAGLFVSQFVLAVISSGCLHPAPWVSLGWAIAASGAYLLERGYGNYP